LQENIHVYVMKILINFANRININVTVKIFISLKNVYQIIINVIVKKIYKNNAKQMNMIVFAILREIVLVMEIINVFVDLIMNNNVNQHVIHVFVI